MKTITGDATTAPVHAVVLPTYAGFYFAQNAVMNDWEMVQLAFDGHGSFEVRRFGAEGGVPFSNCGLSDFRGPILRPDRLR